MTGQNCIKKKNKQKVRSFFHMNCFEFFRSENEILWCDHSKKTSFAKLLHGTLTFWAFLKLKFEIIQLWNNIVQFLVSICMLSTLLPYTGKKKLVASINNLIRLCHTIH